MIGLLPYADTEKEYEKHLLLIGISHVRIDEQNEKNSCVVWKEMKPLPANNRNQTDKYSSQLLSVPNFTIYGKKSYVLPD